MFRRSFAHVISVGLPRQTVHKSDLPAPFRAKRPMRLPGNKLRFQLRRIRHVAVTAWPWRMSAAGLDTFSALRKLKIDGESMCLQAQFFHALQNFTRLLGLTSFGWVEP